jgi:hypothetical protein
MSQICHKWFKYCKYFKCPRYDSNVSNVLNVSGTFQMFKTFWILKIFQLSQTCLKCFLHFECPRYVSHVSNGFNVPSFESFFSNPAAPSCLPLPFFQLSGLGALSSPKVFNCLMAVRALCSRHADVCCGHLTWGLEYLPWPLRIFLFSSFPALRSFLA